MIKIDNYFLKDTALESDQKDRDAFHFNDYVNNLKRIIDEHEPPFNIALVGKWGIGKTTIFNLLQEKLDGKKGHMLHDINAWKYEDDSLRSVFLKKLWLKFGGEKKGIWDRIKETAVSITGEIKDEEKGYWEIVKKMLPAVLALFSVWVLISLLLFFILFLFEFIMIPVIYGIMYNNEIIHNPEFNLLSFWAFFKNNIWIPVVPVVLAAIFNFINSSANKKLLSGLKIMSPAQTAEEYEELFKEQIQEYKKKNPDFEKLIIFIDDLDRLSPKKVVRALDAIKAFVDVKECIFLVACDELILKQAIENHKNKEMKSNLVDIDGEKYLDKIFQFRVPVPPIINNDMQDYAKSLIEKEATALFLECENDFNSIISILIHRNITTARQVKKVVNTFSNKLLIIKNREKKNRKLEKGLLSNKQSLRMVAKLSVLEADFYTFYHKLVNDYNLIDDMIEVYNNLNNYTELSEIKSELRCFFKKSNNKIKLRNKINPLINFLLRTIHVSSDNLAKYIYLAQDAIGLEAGDEKQRELKDALLSGNETAIIELIEGQSLSELEAQSIINELDNGINLELSNTIISTIQLIDYVPEKYKETISNSISTGILRLNSSMDLKEIGIWRIDIKNMIEVYNYSIDKIGITKLLKYSVDLIFSKNKIWKNKFGEELDDTNFNNLIFDTLDYLLSNYNKLPSIVTKKINEFVEGKKDEFKTFPFGKIYKLYKSHTEIFDNRLTIIKFYIDFSNFIINQGNGLEEKLGSEKINIAKTFIRISDKVRSRNYETFISPLPEIILVDKFWAITVVKILNNNTKDIEDKEINLIVNNLLTINFTIDNQISVLKFINQVNWKIEEEEIEEKNNKLVELIQAESSELRELVFDIIVDYCKVNNQNELDKTLNFVFNKMTQENIYDDLIMRLDPLLNDNYRKQMLNKITPVINFGNHSNQAYERVFSLIEILITNEKNHEELLTIFRNNFSYFNNNKWFNRLPWAKNYINMFTLIKKIAKENYINSFINILLNKVSNKKPELMIVGFKNVGDEIRNKEIAEKAIDAAFNRVNKNSALDAFEFFEKAYSFIKEKSNYLTKYVTFLINNLELSPHDFLKTLNIKFSSISKYLDLYKKILSLSDDQFNNNYDWILKTLKKLFVNNNPNLEKLKSYIQFDFEEKSQKILKELIESLSIEEVDEILSSSLNSEFNNELRNKLLIIVKGRKEEFDKKTFAQVVSHILRSDDDNIIEDLCDNLLENYYEFKLYSSKNIIKEYILPAYQSVNMNVKEKVLKVAESFNIEDKFRETIKGDVLADKEIKQIKNFYRFRI